MKKLYSEKLLMSETSIYTVNQTVFESSTPGTYTLNIEKGVFELSICGAGGGGGGSATKHAWYGSNGGSGAAFKGNVKFSNATLTITVGKGGTGGNASGRNAGAGANGTLSSIYSNSKNVITTNAGNGGNGTGDGAGANNGNGGTLVVGNLEIVSSTIKSNGVQKSTASLLNNGYGAGGSYRTSNSGTAGKNGYVRILYKSKNA